MPGADLSSLRVAIIGAGAVALASAAILGLRGHRPVLWSLSGRRTEGLPDAVTITASGALAGEVAAGIARDLPGLLRDADALLIAVDANGHRAVMEAAAPHIRPGLLTIVGAAHALSGLVLAKRLADGGIAAPVMSWNTSAATAHATGPLAVDIRVVRPRIDAAVTPASSAEEGFAAARALFGDRFDPCPDPLAVALLANSNPVFHVPVCLLNLARIEHGEDWAPYRETTPAVGRLMEAIDAERLALGRAFGHAIRSVNAHFHRSFGIPEDTMAAMNAALHARGRGPRGPKAVAHRYLAQDIPYGLVFASELGRLAGVPTPVHDAAIALAAAATGQDYRATRIIPDELGLAGLSRADILARIAGGWPVDPTQSGGRR